MKIYGDAGSGNCYKVKLIAALLDLDYQWVDVDIVSGGTRSNSFLAKNPVGKIPLLELDDGRFLSESNAIIDYLADGTSYFPDDPFERARVLQWQFFEQYSHEPYVAVARYIAKYLGLPPEREAEYHAKQRGGHRALAVMNSQLATTSYIAGNVYTVADISLYAYTHVAHEGGFDLSSYPGIIDWMERVASHPRHVQIG